MMHHHRNCKVAAEILRDLYESWLIVVAGMFVNWNHWRLLAYDPLSPLDPLSKLPMGENQRWAGLFFGCGVILAILQYRPRWVRRCRHRVSLLMVLAELVLVLQLTEWTDRQLWQPFLGIVRELFLALGGAQWGSWIFAHLPAARSLLLSGVAFDFFRLFASFAIFIAAFDSTAGCWRVSVEFLLIGYLPETSIRSQLIQEKHRKRCLERTRKGLLPTPSPESLIYKRLCYICMQKMNSEHLDPGTSGL
ncbi:uncharacterized protein LOC108033147 [Drosophila biarmipes]|uniref:uncharacterized protein LOC108033147 n=1 Tax=Drosophila biarmipes TaxID=125945 RepID=UPI0007E6577D|nr:uncharacterized protein LOC108033147 [Drosophila biarmipes]